jgi:hypothetical protein
MKGDASSDFWLPTLQQQHSVTLDDSFITGNYSFNETLAQLVPLMKTKHYTLFDSGEASETLSYTLAGATGALPVALADEPFAVSQGLTMLHDCRGQTNAYALENFADKLATNIANLHAPTSGPQQVDLGVFARGFAIMDQDLNNYPLVKRVRTPGGSTHDKPIGSILGRPNALTEAITARMDNESAIFGWLGSEHPLVAWMGEHSAITHCSGGDPNLSTLMNVDAGVNFTQKRPAATQAESAGKRDNVGTHTISFIMSDGDSVAYSVDVLPGPKYFGSTARGKVPIGWTLGPALSEISPASIGAYYRNASINDSFIAGPSGMGYIYPNSYRSMDTFAQKTAAYMAKSDMKLVNVIADSLDANWTVPLLAQDQIEAVIYYNYSDYAGMCHATPGLPMMKGCAPIQWVGNKPVLGGRMNLWSGVGAFAAHTTFIHTG